VRLHELVCACVCGCVRARACVRCVRACVRACGSVFVCVFSTTEEMEALRASFARTLSAKVP
jgi:hypothetical protein